MYEHQGRGKPYTNPNAGYGYPPPPGPPPGYQQQHQQPRKRRGWLTAGIVAGIVLVLCAGAAALMMAVAGQAVDQADNPAATVGLGQPARDGQFEFTATKMTCGKTAYGPAKALGVYCAVHLDVANVGDQAQTFGDGWQKAYTADGTEYATDSEAGIYANQGTDVWLKEINPGNKITGVVVFDVPKGTTLDRVELHDSIFSGGVVVKLGG